LYENKAIKKYILVHRGSVRGLEEILKSDGVLIANLYGELGENIVEQNRLNYNFTKKSVELAKENGYSFFFTGHSLGGWLAQQSVYHCNYDFGYQSTRADRHFVTRQLFS
jgi:hypothetical protein